MAINVDYTPIGIAAALGGVAGAGAGKAAFDARSKDELLRKQQADQQMLAQAQNDLLQRQKFQEDIKNNSISTALAYDRMYQDKSQQDAVMSQRKTEQDAGERLARDRMTQDASQFNEQNKRLMDSNDLNWQQYADKQAESQGKRTEVAALIDQTYKTGTPENAKAHLLFKATGRLPEEILVPRATQPGGVANSALDLQRVATAQRATASIFQKYLSEAVDQFGTLKPNVDPNEYRQIQQQYASMVGGLNTPIQNAPAAQPVAPPAPVQQQPGLNPSLSQEQATQIMQSLPQPPAPNTPIDPQNVARTIQGVAQLLGRPTNDPMVIQKAKEIAAHSGWAIPQ